MEPLKHCRVLSGHLLLLALSFSCVHAVVLVCVVVVHVAMGVHDMAHLVEEVCVIPLGHLESLPLKLQLLVLGLEVRLGLGRPHVHHRFGCRYLPPVLVVIPLIPSLLKELIGARSDRLVGAVVIHGPGAIARLSQVERDICNRPIPPALT